MKNILFIYAFFLMDCTAMAQSDSAVYAKFTTQQNRAIFYKNLQNISISRNLSLPLNDNTADKWLSAFSAIELINYQQPWINTKIKIAVDSMSFRSTDFQRALLELLYARNQTAYTSQVNYLLNNSHNATIFAAAATYLLRADSSVKNIAYLQKTTEKNNTQFSHDTAAAIMVALGQHLKNARKNTRYPDLSTLKNLFAKTYLKGNVVVYSIQRKNRDYAGLCIVKDTSGNFLLDSISNLFSVPQLARSLSNMPYFLTNGNTPQGIFRMHGFGKSRSVFIGPTENLQLTMPFESNPAHFLKDSTITDTNWTEKLYVRLLPKQLKNYEPLYQSYYAGAAGRTEIIAHGTTVNEQFYAGQIYHPFTPTAGCLCTKEIWDATGKRIFSDQQKLTNAVKQAGGADGYLLVIELDDTPKAVTINDILSLLPEGIKNN